MSTSIARPVHHAAPVALLAAGLVLAGCGSSTPTADDLEDAEPASEITVLDFYTDEASSQAWQTALDACSADTGIEITRESLPLKEIGSRVLQGASTRTLPALAFVDNVMVKQLAGTGALTPISDYDLTTDDAIPGMVDAATYEGDVYGLSSSANTIALYYNTEMLEEADVPVPTTWDELSDAAAALTQGERRGFAFSAPASEEATWQFLPFFWSNGARLTDVDAPEAVEALAFLTSFVEEGTASASVVSWTQNDVVDQFAAGNAAMMINGPWANAKLDESGTPYEVSPIPVPDAGADLAVPLGGDVGVIPASGADTQLAAAQVLECMTSPDVMLERNQAASRVPAKLTVAEELAEEEPAMSAFVESISNAQARTTDLGESYPEASQALWVAIQSALSGAETPEAALQSAQQTVEGLQ